MPDVLDVPSAREAPVTVPPRLRGAFHQWAAVASLATGAVMTALANNWRVMLVVLAYSLSVTAMFTTSGLYHRVHWRRGESRLRMKRLDHAMIFVFIAGSYTPYAAFLLTGTARVVVLAGVWGAAVAGTAGRLLWPTVPRWLSAPLYVALGWASLALIPQVLERGGVAALVLLAVGGLIYTLGAVTYATRWPDPSPVWFGFHELFHVATIVAAICHYTSIFLALAAVGAL